MRRINNQRGVRVDSWFVPSTDAKLLISFSLFANSGHCVAEARSNITLRVGSRFKDTGGLLINVTEVVTHPNFDKPKLNYDFALLKFPPISFTDRIQPIMLTDEQDIPDGTECGVTGWGMMEQGEKTRELLRVAVFTVNSKTCQENYNTTRVKFRITDAMLCAGVENGAKDACSGDSVSSSN
jgi:Trypsin